MKAELYVGREDGQNFDGPYTLGQIDEMIKGDDSIEEKIFRLVRQPGIGLGYEHIRYSTIPRFTVEFQPDIQAFAAARMHAASTILSGPNNSGKSLLLKQLFAHLGPKTCLLTCNRFSQIDVINSRITDPDERKRLYENFTQHHNAGRYHEDISFRQLDQLISGLDDTKQDKLFAITGQLLGVKVTLQRTEPNNRMSPWYVDLDGQSLKYASSGTRLLFTLLGTLFDEYYTTALIDEPEQGLSPRIQAALAQALYNSESRAEYFPHLKQAFVVTHSHLFLNREVLSDNFIVSKCADVVATRQVRSTAELHELQFGMLGNDLDHLYMPAAIIVVEGPCDTFLSRLITLHVPNRRVSIAVSHGDGRIPEKVQTFSEGFGDLKSSPYRSRLFVVLDARHDMKKSSLERLGVIPDNIHVWTKNGIEWYYPRKHVAAAFKCRESDLLGLDLGQERITLNSIAKTKTELARFVIDRVGPDDMLDTELTTLLKKIKNAVE